MTEDASKVSAGGNTGSDTAFGFTGFGFTGFDLEATARLVGHYQWIEMQLFEVMGGWVQAVDDLEVKQLLATQSHHHAWHAQLWHQQLPELRELDSEALVAPPNEELVAFVQALREPATPSTTVEKLVGVYRVLVPHKITAYTRHLEAASMVTDGPTIRVLEVILRDEMDDWRYGEMLLQSLIDSPTAAQQAANEQAHLEALLVTAGGITGTS